MASGQLQFPSPDQKHCRNVNALSASLLQVYLPPHSRAYLPFQVIEAPLMPGYSTGVLLHEILWTVKSPPTPIKSLRSTGGMTDLLWGGEGRLILISMHMDALHCLSWMHLAFLGIANVPPQRLCMESWNHRIIGSFGSEGTSRGHLVQPPCSEQGHR